MYSAPEPTLICVELKISSTTEFVEIVSPF